MTTTENSRADALTDARILEIAETVGVPDTATDDVLVKFVRACLTASTALQPAAAQIDAARECLMDVVSHHDNIVAGFAAQRFAAQEAQDGDSAAYWKHEIDVAHRMKTQAERALAAAAPMPPNAQLRRVMDLLDAHLGDSDPTLEGMTQEEIEEEFPVVAAMQIIVGLYQDPPTASDTAPSPADERAAFEAWWVRGVPEQYRADTLRLLRQSRELDGKYGIGNAEGAWEGWQACAASANETGADVPRLAFDWQTGFVNEHGYPPDSEDGFAAGYMAALSRSPAMAVEAVDWRELSRLYVELFHCDQQMRSTRDEDGEPHWTQSTVVRDVLADAKTTLDAAPQPAQADARVGLTDALRRAREELSIVEWENDPPNRVVKLFDEIDALLAAHPGQPEPNFVSRWSDAIRSMGKPELRAEVTNPFRDLLAALIDIYDDEHNNAPEDRCYIEGAWSEVLGEARALFVPLPDPAQVSAESPNWVKNALPPEGV